MQRRGVRIALGVVVAAILVIVIVPLFVNADAFRPALENELSSALGRKVTLGHLSFSLWSGSLVAKNVTVADDPAFSSAPFFQAKSLRIGVETGALVFHHQLRVRKFVADEPVIHLISEQNGTWNYSSLGHATATGTNAQGGNGTGAADVTVGKLQIGNGTVDVSSLPATGRPFLYTEVNITLQNVLTTQAMPFTVSAHLPGNGSVEVKGTAGPVNQQNTAATPLQASLALKNFDPVAAGVAPASEGVGMVADVDAEVTSDGKTLTSTGKVVANHLLLSRGGTPAEQPVTLTYAASEDLQARTGQVKDVALQVGSATAHLTGTFRLAGHEVPLNLHVSAPKMPIDQLEALLPAVGIRLPTGSQLKGGTLTADLAVTGTAEAPVIAGPVEMDNTQLAGFDLGSEIRGLKALTGTSGGTAIQTVRANVNSTVPQTQLTNIYADVPAMGTATGNGTVTAAGVLNFQLVAKLSTTSGAGAVVNGAVSALGGVAGGLLHTAVSNGIPLTITGTTANPVIRANVGQMLKGNSAGNSTGQKPGAGSVLGKLLGH